MHAHVYPDSKVHVAHKGPTWVLLAPGGPHVGPMNLALRVYKLWNQFTKRFMSSNSQSYQTGVNSTYSNDEIRSHITIIHLTCLFAYSILWPYLIVVLHTKASSIFTMLDNECIIPCCNDPLVRIPVLWGSVVLTWFKLKLWQ